MNILLIEDDLDFADAVIGEIIKLGPSTVYRHAQSNLSAVELIKKEFFDLIILDLKIPLVDNELNAESAHGIAVFTFAKLKAPGTPILVLTGSAADENIDIILKHATQVDVWGEGRKIQMTNFLSKHKLGQLPQILKESNESIKNILDIEIKRDGCELSLGESRLIRIFGKKFGAARCLVAKLSGGLSGTTVYRLYTWDRSGNSLHNAVCKIGLQSEILDESSRYDRHISRLDPIATPRKLIDILAGGKDLAGVFYGLVQGYPLTGFSLIKEDKVLVQRVIVNVAALFLPWTSGESSKTISDIRRRVLDDENFVKCKDLLSIKWFDDFEKHEIQTRWCCTHGDLHGLNILISSDGTPILIDYGDVQHGPACLDPVTLELSLHFHPDGPLRDSKWPSLLQAKQIENLDAYLIDCPCPTFVRACREWAFNVSPGTREIAVTMYAYLMRQLKYPNPNIELISALLEGTKKMYDDTFI